LYIIKSIGQYRPLESNVDAVVSAEDISLTWDTPTIYNYNSASLTSASIAHNHSQRFKQHDTDVYVQWGSGSVMGNFEYHDRVSSDNTSIAMNIGSTSLRVIGIVALKDIPRQDLFEEDEDFNTRIEEYLGLSGSAQGVYDLFKIFDTGVFSLFE
jgi:hypothetical protein